MLLPAALNLFCFPTFDGLICYCKAFDPMTLVNGTECRGNV